MKHLLPLLLLSTLLLSFNPAPQSRIDISWLNGHWGGLGYQPEAMAAKTWTIQLKANTKEKSFKIDYASLECNGDWEISEIFENRVIFKEKITKGVENCTPEGEVIVTFVSENYISYSYFLPRGGERYLDSFATLRKLD